MPFGDGTGPAGQGAMTGRAMGFCNGFNNPGCYGGGLGRQRQAFTPGAGRVMGRGQGRGMGRGFRSFQNAQPMMPQTAQPYNPRPVTKQEEVSYIKDQIDLCKSEIETYETRLKDLEKNQD